MSRFEEQLGSDPGRGKGREPLSEAATNWFAVYTSPRHEKRVGFHMAQRQIEHFLPVYRSQRKWSDGSKVTLDLPLFPGYIFACIKRIERVRVLEVPGVLTVVSGTCNEPAALAGDEINALRSGLHLRKVEPHPLLVARQRARIRSGPLAGLEGIVVRQKGSIRVVLTVDLVMQSLAVEVDGSELEPLDSEILNNIEVCTVQPVTASWGDLNGRSN